MSDSERSELRAMSDSGRVDYGSTDDSMPDYPSNVMPPGRVPGADPDDKQYTLKKTNTLVEAKDRAQLTATTAMSVVNVALLKELLDRGPDGNRYYTAVLWLICLSLASQVLVGALAMMVSNMRRYYKKYGDDLCGDVFASVCRVKIMRKKDEDDGQGDTVRQPGVKCCCLPLYITTDVNPPYQYKVIDEYNEWRSNATDDDIRQAELNVDLQYISAAIEDALDKLHKLQDMKDDEEKAVITEAEYQSEVKKLEHRLAAARERKDKNLSAQKKLRISLDRGTILSNKVDDIRHEHVLKEISFWQDIINYLLYFIFIFNAFIAGLGIFSGSSSSSDVAPDASVTGSVIVSP